MPTTTANADRCPFCDSDDVASLNPCAVECAECEAVGALPLTAGGLPDPSGAVVWVNGRTRARARQAFDDDVHDVEKGGW